MLNVENSREVIALERIARALEQLVADHKPKPVGSWQKVKDTTGREPEWTDTGLRSTGDWIP